MTSAAPTVKILVTCVGGRLIYDIVHALRAADDFNARVIGIDADPQAHGRLLCDRFAVLPIAEAQPQAYVAQLLALHADDQIDVILALSEGEARILSQNRETFLDRGVHLSVSSADTVETMSDKLLMLERVQGSGLHSTPFMPIESLRDLDIALNEFAYGRAKVVVKPRRGRGSRGVLIFDADRAEFEPLLPNRFCGTGPREAVLRAMEAEDMGLEELLAVPYVGGPVFDVDCIAVGGALSDVSARLRQLRNPLWPTSTGHKIVLDPDVLAYASALCEAFGVDGAADYDIALDDDDRPVIFDAGARFSGSVGGSFTAGGNFPAQLVRVLMGLERQPMTIADGMVLRPYITMAAIPAANEADLL